MAELPIIFGRVQEFLWFRGQGLDVKLDITENCKPRGVD